MNGSSLYILDANTTGYIISGRSRTARQSFKAGREHSTIAISAITQAEILFGLENKPAATRLRDAVGGYQAMALPSRLALLVATVSLMPLSPPCFQPAFRTAIALSTGASDTDWERRAAGRVGAKPKAQNSLPRQFPPCQQ